MPVKRKIKLTLLVDKEFHAKLVKLAGQESRSMHAQILVWLRAAVAKAEKEHDEDA